MKPAIVPHNDYRSFLNHVGERYRINWRSKPPALRELYLRIRDLDLSSVDRIMQPLYSGRGLEARQPSCMMRSLLIMVATKCLSIPAWSETLHTSNFHAILSGFHIVSHRFHCCGASFISQLLPYLSRRHRMVFIRASLEVLKQVQNPTLVCHNIHIVRNYANILP